jgi:hypothetical protein
MEVPQGVHTGALRALPEQYQSRIVAFFDGALLGGND